MIHKLIAALQRCAQQNGSADSVRERFGIYAGVVGLACNALLFGGKITIGLVANSVSVVADAFNNLADAATSAVTLLGFHFARKPADKEHPYGHARAEYLMGAVVAVLILLVGGELLINAAHKIFAPTGSAFSAVTAVVLVLSILVKLWMRLFYNKAAAHITSVSLLAAADDSRNDVFATIGVLLGGLLYRIWGVDADGFIGAVVALFILLSGVEMLKKALSPLLGEAPSVELVRQLHALIGEYDGVLGTHDVMVHAYGPARVFATAHVEMSAQEGALYCHGVLDNIERRAQRELGVHLVLHLDPVEPENEEVVALREQVRDAVQAIQAGLDVHDFRVVKTYDHMNVIFDVEVPDVCRMDADEIKRAVENSVRKMDARYYPVVDIDRNYLR